MFRAKSNNKQRRYQDLAKCPTNIPDYVSE